MRTKLMVSLFLAGGMLALVQAQQPGRGFGGGGFGGPSFLVMNESVQQDLKMTDDQITKVKEWGKEFRTKSEEIRKDKGVEAPTKGGGFKRPSPEQQEKIAAANAEISKVAYKDLGDVLKKEQVERLKQIDRQNQGINAFTDPEVLTALNLTDTQKASIKSVSADFTKDRDEINKEARGDGGKNFDKEKFADAQKKIQKIQKESFAKVTDLLTDDQKKTWKTLTGETFDVSKLTGFPMRKKD